MDKYINKEETIERINRLFTKNHDGSVAKNDYNSGLYAAKAEIVFITAADVQPVNQWISIDERLPQDGEEALVYAGNRGVMIGLYDSVLQVWLDYECCGLKVTHWQPLPEPPKKEG